MNPPDKLSVWRYPGAFVTVKFYPTTALTNKLGTLPACVWFGTNRAGVNTYELEFATANGINVGHVAHEALHAAIRIVRGDKRIPKMGLHFPTIKSVAGRREEALCHTVTTITNKVLALAAAKGIPYVTV